MKATSRRVEVLLPAAVPHGFDYAVPEGAALKSGDLVSVPFGRGESLGVVWGEGKAALDEKKLKSVKTHHAEFPAFSPAMREFFAWAAWYNCAPPGMVLKMALPFDVTKKSREKKNPHPTPLPHPATPSAEAEGFAVASAGEGSAGIAAAGEGFSLAELSEAQQVAAHALEEKIGRGFSVTLLDGVTGSGKTEVYFAAIAKVLGNRDLALGIGEKDSSPQSPMPNPQCLILLPEIALSVQWLERFEKRFGFTPVVWNSEITPARKRVAWQKIARGETRVVIGARSALFLPYKNLALIVVDEEHDQSYKQEEGVIYHARDMAVARGRFEKLPVVLVSATPSLESYHNARLGKYAELSLPMRHGGAQLPELELLDMRKVEIERGAFISQPLREALVQTVANGGQATLFLNRRGYAPLLLCRTCGHRFQCPDCTAWLVLHKGNRRTGELENWRKEKEDLFPSSPIPQFASSTLQCHHCNYRMPVPEGCPACSKDTLYACGPGVERLEEEVRQFLPQARLKVMASDSMASYRELADTINAMSDKKIDLLIGTQMVAKGHHFASLSLVGIVDADLGLAGGDLRAAERTYQLLHQLAGRAGREQIAGKVYMQSFLPEHPVMKALLAGDRESFMQAELAARENAGMPPFTRLAALIVEGNKEEQAMRAARQLAAAAPRSEAVHVLGPAPAPLYRLSGRYRFRLLIKAYRAVNLPDTMRHWVEAVKVPSPVRVKIDIDPMGFL